MIRKINKIILLILCTFLIFGCSENRFKKNWDLNIFSFGFVGHDAYDFCKEKIPNFIKKYSNGINPSRSCIRYQYYTCHINHYCMGDKNCDKEAAQFWTNSYFVDKNGTAITDLEKRVEVTKNGCDIEANQCNSAKLNDTSCRRYKVGVK